MTDKEPRGTEASGIATLAMRSVDIDGDGDPRLNVEGRSHLWFSPDELRRVADEIEAWQEGQED